MGCKPSKHARSRIRAADNRQEPRCLCSPRHTRKTHKCSTVSLSNHRASSSSRASSKQQAVNSSQRPLSLRSTDLDFPEFSTTSAVYRRSASKTSKITLRLSCDGSTLEIEQCDYDLERNKREDMPTPRPWASAPNLCKLRDSRSRVFREACRPVQHSASAWSPGIRSTASGTKGSRVQVPVISHVDDRSTSNLGEPFDPSGIPVDASKHRPTNFQRAFSSPYQTHSNGYGKQTGKIHAYRDAGRAQTYSCVMPEIQGNILVHTNRQSSTQSDSQTFETKYHSGISQRTSVVKCANEVINLVPIEVVETPTVQGVNIMTQSGYERDRSNGRTETFSNNIAHSRTNKISSNTSAKPTDFNFRGLPSSLHQKTNSSNENSSSDISPDFEEIPVNVISSYISPMPTDVCDGHRSALLTNQDIYHATQSRGIRSSRGETMRHYTAFPVNKEPSGVPFSERSQSDSKFLRSNGINQRETGITNADEPALDPTLKQTEATLHNMSDSISYVKHLTRGLPSPPDSESILNFVSLGCPIPNDMSFTMISADDDISVESFTSDHDFPYKFTDLSLDEAHASGSYSTTTENVLSDLDFDVMDDSEYVLDKCDATSNERMEIYLDKATSEIMNSPSDAETPTSSKIFIPIEDRHVAQSSSPDNPGNITQTSYLQKERENTGKERESPSSYHGSLMEVMSTCEGENCISLHHRQNERDENGRDGCEGEKSTSRFPVGSNLDETNELTMFTDWDSRYHICDNQLEAGIGARGRVSCNEADNNQTEQGISRDKDPSSPTKFMTKSSIRTNVSIDSYGNDHCNNIFPRGYDHGSLQLVNGSSYLTNQVGTMLETDYIGHIFPLSVNKTNSDHVTVHDGFCYEENHHGNEGAEYLVELLGPFVSPGSPMVSSGDLDYLEELGIDRILLMGASDSDIGYTSCENGDDSVEKLNNGAVKERVAHHGFERIPIQQIKENIIHQNLSIMLSLGGQLAKVEPELLTSDKYVTSNGNRRPGEITTLQTEQGGSFINGGKSGNTDIAGKSEAEFKDLVILFPEHFPGNNGESNAIPFASAGSYHVGEMENSIKLAPDALRNTSTAEGDNEADNKCAITQLCDGVLQQNIRAAGHRLEENIHREYNGCQGTSDLHTAANIFERSPYTEDHLSEILLEPSLALTKVDTNPVSNDQKFPQSRSEDITFSDLHRHSSQSPHIDGNAFPNDRDTVESHFGGEIPPGGASLGHGQSGTGDGPGESRLSIGAPNTSGRVRPRENSEGQESGRTIDRADRAGFNLDEIPHDSLTPRSNLNRNFDVASEDVLSGRLLSGIKYGGGTRSGTLGNSPHPPSVEDITDQTSVDETETSASRSGSLTERDCIEVYTEEHNFQSDELRRRCSNCLNNSDMSKPSMDKCISHIQVQESAPNCSSSMPKHSLSNAQAKNRFKLELYNLSDASAHRQIGSNDSFDSSDMSCYNEKESYRDIISLEEIDQSIEMTCRISNICFDDISTSTNENHRHKCVSKDVSSGVCKEDKINDQFRSKNNIQIGTDIPGSLSKDFSNGNVENIYENMTNIAHSNLENCGHFGTASATGDVLIMDLGRECQETQTSRGKNTKKNRRRGKHSTCSKSNTTIFSAPCTDMDYTATTGISLLPAPPQNGAPSQNSAVLPPSEFSNSIHPNSAQHLYLPHAQQVHDIPNCSTGFCDRSNSDNRNSNFPLQPNTAQTTESNRIPPRHTVFSLVQYFEKGPFNCSNKRKH